MKKNISIIITLLFAAAILWSCNKKSTLVASTLNLDGLAYIKVAQFSPSFRQIFNNRDSINVYANGVKLNAPFLTFGSLYPSIATVTDLYAGVPAGTQTIRFTVNGNLTPDSITLGTFTKTLDLGAYYSFIITDSILNTNESMQIWTKDNFVLSDSTHFTLRFIHAIVNDSTGKAVDIYSTRKASNIFSNITPATTTTFSSLGYSLISDTIIVRRAGTLFELARLNTAIFARQRAYSLVYKGLGNSTTAPKGRSLTLYANQ